MQCGENPSKISPGIFLWILCLNTKGNQRYQWIPALIIPRQHSQQSGVCGSCSPGWLSVALQILLDYNAPSPLVVGSAGCGWWMSEPNIWRATGSPNPCSKMWGWRHTRQPQSYWCSLGSKPHWTHLGLLLRKRPRDQVAPPTAREEEIGLAPINLHWSRP